MVTRGGLNDPGGRLQRRLQEDPGGHEGIL